MSYWNNTTTSADTTYYYNDTNSTTSASDGTYTEYYYWIRRSPNRTYRYVITPTRVVKKSRKPLEFLRKLTNSFKRLRSILDKLDLCHYCGDIHNKKNMKRRRYEEIYICDKCYDESNFETCINCGVIHIREDLKWDITDGEYYCGVCYMERCAICSRKLHNPNNFPEDYPEKFKFCCGCHSLLENMISQNSITKSPVHYKMAKKLKEICFGTIDVWEKNPLIS